MNATPKSSNEPAAVPFHLPQLGEEEIAEVVATLRSGWLTSGPRTARFEKEFAAYVGSSYALAVNSCTAGLDIALTALEVGSGDEVITTPLTFCATVNSILHRGAKPILADIGSDFNISPDAIQAVITPRTKMILPVHMAGLPCDMDAIHKLARAYNLRVVEDAAHACGSVYKEVAIGSGASDAVAFSFYATKNLSTGEGGMLTTASEELYDRMKVLCLHGISRDAWNRYSGSGKWYYEVTACGYKSNMSDVLSAIGIHQLRRLDAMNLRRRQIANKYNLAFAEMDEVQLPPDRSDSVHPWHLYILRLNLDQLSIGRDQFFDELKRRGIGASVHFIPIPLHPYYQQVLDPRYRTPRALAEFPRMISLPIFPAMSDQDLQRVIEAVKDTISIFRRPRLVHGGLTVSVGAEV